MSATGHGLHNCAAEGCQKQIASHRFMCLNHWRMVPRTLQRAVRDAWRKYGQAVNSIKSRGRDAALQAAADLRKIQDMVINSVREKEIQRAIKNAEHGDNLDLGAADRNG